ncbi:MAG: glycosyltransferase family 2 protein [Bryobacteraceae bacterium]|nr:glycosyltransferase family 2 protein [Bryobacteraceae bacterium]
MIAQRTALLSIVTVNYFSEQKLARCLRSLEQQPEPVEVIVADNGSDPAQSSSIRSAYPSVAWRSMGRNCGFSAACNAGAQLAQSDKLLFLNPDTIVKPGALLALALALDSSEYANSILGCAIRDADGAMQLSCRRFPDWKTFVAGRFSLLTRLAPGNSWSSEYLMSDFDHQSIRAVDWVSGAAMAMSRRTFGRLGGFDERFFLYFEDVDICKRGAALGIGTYYFPDAEVEHLIGGSSERIPVRALTYRHQSMWKYYKRHCRTGWLDPLAYALVFARLAAMASLHWTAGWAAPALRPELGTQKTTK